MKYIFSNKLPKHGETHLNTVFLFFPKILTNGITNEEEIRWLEYATIKKVYVINNTWIDGFGNLNLGWNSFFWNE